MTPVTVTELGTERRCSICGDWWPLDEEFYYRQRNGYGGFQSICKACKATRRGSGDSRKGRGIDRALISDALAYGRHPRDIAVQVGCSVRLVYRVKASA